MAPIRLLFLQGTLIVRSGCILLHLARDMPKLETMKFSANLLKISLLMALLPASASAALIFTIDTFTPDQLTISIPAGSATLDATGTPPPDSDASYLYIIDPDGLNENWILGDTSSSVSGAINGIGFFQHGSFDSSLDPHDSSGDVLYLAFNDPLSDGDTVTSAITATWSGSNAFDPSAVSSLSLIWGEDGYPSSYPFGDPQGTTSTSAVPDTGSTAALLGVGVAALVFARRKLG